MCCTTSSKSNIVTLLSPDVSPASKLAFFNVSAFLICFWISNKSSIVTSPSPEVSPLTEIVKVCVSIAVLIVIVWPVEISVLVFSISLPFLSLIIMLFAPALIKLFFNVSSLVLF